MTLRASVWTPERAWRLAGALLALGAYLAPGRRVKAGRYGKVERRVRFGILAHYVVAVAYGEDSAIQSRFWRVTWRVAGGAAFLVVAYLLVR